MWEFFIPLVKRKPKLFIFYFYIFCYQINTLPLINLLLNEQVVGRIIKDTGGTWFQMHLCHHSIVNVFSEKLMTKEISEIWFWCRFTQQRMHSFPFPNRSKWVNMHKLTKGWCILATIQPSQKSLIWKYIFRFK